MVFLKCKIIVKAKLVSQSLKQIKGISMSGLLPRISIALLMLACVCPTVSAQEEDNAKEGLLYIKVTGNREIFGTPVELDTLKVTTSFGEVSIPTEKISGIKLHVGDDDSAVIAFKNGDLITGLVKLESVSLKTSWGKAHVNLKQIQTMTTNRNARFIKSDGTGSKGWRFSNGIPTELP